MNQDEGIRNTKALVWGFFLIALGMAFLLDRFGTWDFPGLGQLWPLVFVVIGVNQLIERRPGSALTMTLLGAWFLACEFDWQGLTYRNSWSLVLVAVGAGIVLRSLTGEDRRRRTRCTP